MNQSQERDLSWDEVYRFESRPQVPQQARKKPYALLIFVLILIGSSFFFKGTLAANITLGGGIVEFGQGVQVTATCSGSTPLTVTPVASFGNQSGSGTFYYKSFTISNIPSSCSGKSFTLNAYDSTTATTLALYDSTYKDVVIYNDNGNYLSASVTVTTQLPSHPALT